MSLHISPPLSPKDKIPPQKYIYSSPSSPKNGLNCHSPNLSSTTYIITSHPTFIKQKMPSFINATPFKPRKRQAEEPDNPSTPQRRRTRQPQTVVTPTIDPDTIDCTLINTRMFAMETLGLNTQLVKTYTSPNHVVSNLFVEFCLARRDNPDLVYRRFKCFLTNCTDYAVQHMFNPEQTLALKTEIITTGYSSQTDQSQSVIDSLLATIVEYPFIINNVFATDTQHRDAGQNSLLLTTPCLVCNNMFSQFRDILGTTCRFPTQPNDLATNPSRGYFSAVNKTLRNHAIQSHYSSATLADKFKCSDDNRLLFRAIHIFMSNLMFEMEQKIDELMTQLTIPLTEDEALRSNLDWTAPEVPLALEPNPQEEREPLDAEQQQTEQYHNTNEHHDPNPHEHQDPTNNPSNTSAP